MDKKSDITVFAAPPDSKPFIPHSAVIEHAPRKLVFSNGDIFTPFTSKVNLNAGIKGSYSLDEEIATDIFQGEPYELFRTDRGSCFFATNVDGNLKAFTLDGKIGRDDFEYFLQLMGILSDFKNSEITKMYRALYITAKNEGTHIKQEPRIFREEDTVYYDLHDVINPKYVVINKLGYEIEDGFNIRFKSNSTQSLQSEPLPGGSLDLLDYYLNMGYDDMLLLKIYLLCAFIPGFEHPILLLEGEENSGKTSLSRLLKNLIDPTSTGTLTLPNKRLDLILNLDFHYFVPYDNLPDKISEEVSNLLCQAYSGGGVEARQLFTDNNIISRQFQRIILLNGINIGSLRSDLHRRILTIHLDKIVKEKERTPEYFENKFLQEKALILGAIFEKISEAFNIVSTMESNVIEHMNGFERYGYACAEALNKGSGEKFISIFRASVEKQKERAAEDDPFVDIIIHFMSDKSDTWIGRMTDLRFELQKLSRYPKLDYMKNIANTHPKELSKKMNTKLGLLLSQGVRAEFHRGNKRIWHITNLNLGKQAIEPVPATEAKGIVIPSKRKANIE